MNVGFAVSASVALEVAALVCSVVSAGAESARVAELWQAAVASGTSTAADGIDTAQVAEATQAAVPSGTRVGALSARVADESQAAVRESRAGRWAQRGGALGGARLQRDLRRCAERQRGRALTRARELLSPGESLEA